MEVAQKGRHIYYIRSIADNNSQILHNIQIEIVKLCFLWHIVSLKIFDLFIIDLHNLNFFRVQELFDTADLMYILPYYRATVYLMGILLGYLCRVYKDVKLTKNQLKFGWYVSTILFLLAFLGPAHMGSINYVYDPLHAANYAAFSPIA